jgi:quercetin dioxygenase-like cupin family protein
VYSLNWDHVPETENLPNNFRVALAGKEMGINRIRWVHPTSLPAHTHEDSEQAIIMLQGAINFTINGELQTLGEGDVTIVPRGAVHSGESISGEAMFIEVFAPLRIENLFGFLGGAGMPKKEGDG